MSDDINDSKTVVEDLKGYLHILTTDDDNNLETLLKTAHSTLNRWCGSFDFENEEGKQLVFDYVRYMRAGASEYFYQSFQPQIHSFAFSLMEVPTDGEISKEE